MKPIRSGVKTLCYEITVSSSQEQDGYFLCLSFLTSVIMAHSIIINVNRSEYVTILPPLSVRSRNGWHDRPTGCPVKYIILSMYDRTICLVANFLICSRTI